MTRSGQAFGTALWFALVGHGRNRLALVLALGFMPLWIWLMRLCTMEADMRFEVPASGGDLVANSNHVSQLVGAMNAVTFLIGFTMFMSTFKSVELDRRLVLAGYPRTQLLLAKVVALQLIAALVATYAVAILGFWWPVRHWWALVLAVFAAANVLLEPDQGQSLLIFTATPGTESHEKLSLLTVLGTDRFAADAD